MCAPVSPNPRSALVARLRTAGCVFAEDEAGLLLSAAGSADERMAMVERRTAVAAHRPGRPACRWPAGPGHPVRPDRRLGPATAAGQRWTPVTFGRTGQCCSDRVGPGPQLVVPTPPAWGEWVSRRPARSAAFRRVGRPLGPRRRARRPRVGPATPAAPGQRPGPCRCPGSRTPSWPRGYRSVPGGTWPAGCTASSGISANG